MHKVDEKALSVAIDMANASYLNNPDEDVSFNKAIEAAILAYLTAAKPSEEVDWWLKQNQHGEVIALSQSRDEAEAEQGMWPGDTLTALYLTPRAPEASTVDTDTPRCYEDAIAEGLPHADDNWLTPEETAVIVEDINSGRWPYLTPPVPEASTAIRELLAERDDICMKVNIGLFEGEYDPDDLRPEKLYDLCVESRERGDEAEARAEAAEQRIAELESERETLIEALVPFQNAHLSGQSPVPAAFETANTLLKEISENSGVWGAP